jgi:hypothetical protein
MFLCLLKEQEKSKQQEVKTGIKESRIDGTGHCPEVFVSSKRNIVFHQRESLGLISGSCWEMDITTI